MASSILIDKNEEIDHKMYKYGEGAIHMVKHDNTNLSLTHAAPAFVELIKLEKFSMSWISLHKINKPLDILISVLSEIKNIFKPIKCTLYILDKTL
jgi:hypothetical protein